MPFPEQSFIRIKGARQHNLRSLDLSIPKNRLVVITGPSGSGKSSLAFDTLFAEGQRRYVESLSTYARQFLDQLQKPEVDWIEGLSPAIAIEQHLAPPNPRSTVAITTEIYDYLRLLFSSIGVAHDPATGEVIRRQSPQQMVDEMMTLLVGTRIMLLAPLMKGKGEELRAMIEQIRREGFVRMRLDGIMVDLGSPEPLPITKNKSHTIEAVIDRLIIAEGVAQRLDDSLQTCLKWGRNTVLVLINSFRNSTDTANCSVAPVLGASSMLYTLNSCAPSTPCTSSVSASLERSLIQLPGSEEWEERRFSTDFCNPTTGFTMEKLTPKSFSFNSPLGACPACHGLGTEEFCDPGLIVDVNRTLAGGAIKPWRSPDKRMRHYYQRLLEALTLESNASMDIPFSNLPEEFKKQIFYGTGNQEVLLGSEKLKPFEGLVAMVERQRETSSSELTRHRLKVYFRRKECSVCHGKRLRPEILAVTIATRNNEVQKYSIDQFCRLTIAQARQVIARLQLSDSERFIVGDILREINHRLTFLEEVGLGYLTLHRESGTLSGGEAQRIRLATQIGSALSGVLYVLDEPSIGLHQQDHERLIKTLYGLRDLGNSVIVVEHDEETMMAADHIIDMGPGAGPLGGRVLGEGSPKEIMANPESLTGRYLNGTLKIPVPTQRHQTPKISAPGKGWLTIVGAKENNLKNLTIGFPIGLITCVTGLSGSGKSTLVNDILYRSLAHQFYRSKELPGAHEALLGVEQLDKVIVIDQSPIGRTPRSNPATYSGIFGPIRDLFANLPAAKARGYQPNRFSCNVKGGRCEHCQGDGMRRIEMHFLADVFVPCEVCGGKRFQRETLEITYKGRSIADVLEMNVQEAAAFFRAIPSIHGKLERFEEVGLGYLKLGQSATTLSGGEAQRLKLASELGKRETGKTLYLLDEPTTGLHFTDIQKLLDVLLKLREGGNTLIVIEHNLEVIKSADWVIDLGPQGGAAGGELVIAGTPEELAACPGSFTGKFLKRLL